MRANGLVPQAIMHISDAQSPCHSLIPEGISNADEGYQGDEAGLFPLASKCSPVLFMASHCLAHQILNKAMRTVPRRSEPLIPSMTSVLHIKMFICL